MCRFISYIGDPLLMDLILSQPVNSLVAQSVAAREIQHPMNGDGFGVGWYNHAIDATPGIYKSIQPAWNDINLLNVFQKVQSECFFAHVRAATAGGVAKNNCHPFRFQQLLMMHNGGIDGFENIKRPLRKSLSDVFYDWIQGQTDTEHFYALFLDILYKQEQRDSDAIASALGQAVKQVQQLQKQYNESRSVHFNLVVTNGYEIVALRYSDDPNKIASSMHYAAGSHYEVEQGQCHIHTSTGQNRAVIVSSERLNDFPDEWNDVPPSHFVKVRPDYSIELDTF